jgi:uncharacterized protein (TIGR03437 family)
MGTLCLAATCWAQQAQQSFVPAVLATPGSNTGILYGVYHGTLVKSSDLGVTWIPLYVTEAGLPQPPVSGFDIDRNDPNTLYLATAASAGAFWKSSDAGATWTMANSGLPTSGPAADYFKQIQDSGTLLYLKYGNEFFKSPNQGRSWVVQGFLPGSAGSVEIAESSRAYVYYIEPSSLAVSFSQDEGHSWQNAGNIPASLGNPVITGTGVLYFNPFSLLVSVAGQGAWGSLDGGATWVDQTALGLGEFTKISSFTVGPTYAFTAGYLGTYRSADSGQSWQGIGTTGDRHGVSAVDPTSRTTVFGVSTLFGSNAPTALASSVDAGTNWTPIPATIVPTIAKPVSTINVVLEEGAPYATPFNVTAEEDPTWKLPVTVSSSGEPWLQLAATSGFTPLANSITINTAGLAPGVYTSTISISAPQSHNKSVSVPVRLTIRPLGSLGPAYLISTVVGNGNAADITHTSGKATTIGIGAAKALTFDASGNLLISASNQLWQFNAGNIGLLAGNGVRSSSGDGPDPLAASLYDPDAIALDSTGAIYLTEYAPERVRKLALGIMSTYLDESNSIKYNLNVKAGSHSLLFDGSVANGALLATPVGLLLFNGATLLVKTGYAFSDPYGMVADITGNLYISDRGLHQIFKITPTGVVSLVAGTGLPGFSGDGGPATQAALNAPAGLALDGAGSLYIADSGNQRIRVIGTDGNIRTIAGSGVTGFQGDGATADFAALSSPLGVAIDGSGNVLIADSGNNRVRMLTLQTTPVPKLGALQGPSFATKLSPGGLFTLYGDLLAPAGAAAQVTSAPWPRDMAGVAVTINGVLAPLYYVSQKQINGQIPFETATGTATAIVTSNGSPSASISFTVVPAEPDVLVQGGGTQAIAVNQNGTVNTPSNPAHPGDYEVLYLSGIGIPDHPVPTGAASPTAEPLARSQYPYTITLKGTATQTFFLGYAPGYPALVQANFQIPANLTPGDVPLVVTVNGESSTATVLSVRAN